MMYLLSYPLLQQPYSCIFRELVDQITVMSRELTEDITAITRPFIGS